jgi:hypothetical protein
MMRAIGTVSPIDDTSVSLRPSAIRSTSVGLIASGVATPIIFGKLAEHPPTQRPHQETRSKQDRGIELLHNRIAVGKERSGKIKREGRKSVKVVSFDQIADRADEDRLDAP